MNYSTFYAKLTPNGAASGTKYNVEVLGVTAIVDGQKVYGSTAMYFAIRPKSSGMATVNFINATTGDVVGTRQILVRSTVLAKPTYSLAASATTVNEGGSVTFTLDTSDVLEGTTFPYMVTGISAADLSSNNLNGVFKIGSDGTAKVTLTIAEDYVTEGDETLTLTVTGRSLSKSVVIKDTSQNPTYSIGWYWEASGITPMININEGGTAYAIVKTTNVPNGTVLNIGISGTGINAYDLSAGAMNTLVTINNNTAYAPYTFTNDLRTEGAETIWATLTRDGNWVANARTDINDTSWDQQVVYYEGTHYINIGPGQTFTFDMYPSGGGGGSSGWTPIYENQWGTKGGDVVLYGPNSTLIAGGGNPGKGGAWGNGSSFSNGIPGTGGATNLSGNNGVFGILVNRNGNNAVIGDRWSVQPTAWGFTSAAGINNRGGVGANGVGDERWSYGGSGGSGSNVKAQYTNNTAGLQTLTLVVGPTGIGNRIQHWGGDAEKGHVVLYRGGL